MDFGPHVQIQQPSTGALLPLLFMMVDKLDCIKSLYHDVLFEDLQVTLQFLPSVFSACSSCLPHIFAAHPCVCVCVPMSMPNSVDTARLS